MEPLMGEIKMFAGTFAPNGWYFCDGALLSIAQNTALFSILGTTYGGDGVQTFQLPDLRGRMPIHAGNGAGRGVSQYLLGQIGGVETVTLNAQQLPAHNHTVQGATAAPNQFTPANNFVAIQVDKVSQNPVNTYNDGTEAGVELAAMNAKTIGFTGNNQPVSLVTPYLGMNYIIAWTGIYPSRP